MYCVYMTHKQPIAIYRLSRNNQLTIPFEVIEKLDLKIGGKVMICDIDDEIVIRKA